MAILDIRGTHGSGKSWVVHSLLKRFSNEPILEEGVHIGYVISEFDCAVVGRYETICGGCDVIKTADEVVRQIRLLNARHKHTILEGILVSHTFARYNKLAMEMEERGYSYQFLFLNTPLNTCIRRVRQRRKDKGNEKPFNPKKLVKDWHLIWKNVRRKMEEAGRDVIVLNYQQPLSQLLQFLKGMER